MTRVLIRTLRICLAAAALALPAACATAKTGSGGLDRLTPGASTGTTAGSTPTGAATTSTPTAAITGPHIVYFKVTQAPACPVVPSTDAPFGTPGVDVIVSWKATGVDKVALSIDDPNFFKNNGGTGSWRSDYGPTDQQDLPFACDTSHPNTTHTYTINTTGGGTSVSKTISVTARSQP